MFSAAGLLAFFGLALLLTTAVLALDLVLPAWLAALIVACCSWRPPPSPRSPARTRWPQATPAAPERTIAGVKEDVATMKGHAP